MPRKLKENWIIAYGEAIDPVSEAPNQFNLWAAISVIGAVLKKRVYIPRGTYNIYPNQYIVFVGPPGVGKGTALNAAYKFAEHLKLINVIADRVTAPQILVRLSTQINSTASMQSNGQLGVNQADPTAVLKIPELSTLLQASDWMNTLLCDLWDRGEYSYDTKNSGSAVIQTGMCVSLMGACVLDYIRKLTKDTNASVSSGFTARTVFVYGEEQSKKITWPDTFDIVHSKLPIITDLLTDLIHISSLQGMFNVTKEAKDYFDKWYLNLKTDVNDSIVMQYFKTRMHVHVLKLAMIFSCASSDDLIIKETDMILAITSIRYIQRNIDKIFRSVGASELAEAIALVQHCLERIPGHGATFDQLYTFLYKEMTTYILGEAINSLLRIGYIRSDEVTQGNKTIVVFQLMKSPKQAAAIDINLLRKYI
jgi:Protein of unknown function (DUF3987)